MPISMICLAANELGREIYWEDVQRMIMLQYRDEQSVLDEHGVKKDMALMTALQNMPDLTSLNIEG